MKFTYQQASRLLELITESQRHQDEQGKIRDILSKEFPGFASWQSEMIHDAKVYLEAYEDFKKDSQQGAGK